MPADTIFCTFEFRPVVAAIGFGAPPTEDFENMLSMIGHVIDYHQPYLTWLDLREMDGVPLAWRKRTNDFISQYRQGINQYCMGRVHLVSSRPVAAVLNAIQWVASAPQPIESFTDEALALRFARDCAAQNRVVLPENFSAQSLRRRALEKLLASPR